jgi:hypothetical protein
VELIEKALRLRRDVGIGLRAGHRTAPHRLSASLAFRSMSGMCESGSGGVDESHLPFTSHAIPRRDDGLQRRSSAASPQRHFADTPDSVTRKTRLAEE